jgi:hypothetical protein
LQLRSGLLIPELDRTFSLSLRAVVSGLRYLFSCFKVAQFSYFVDLNVCHWAHLVARNWRQIQTSWHSSGGL